MKIGELARLSDCQVVTIRFYEKEGLLKKPERTGKNYRLYDDTALERLRFIRRCRMYGMNLAEIKALLVCQEHPIANCDWIDTMVAGHIEKIRTQIAELRNLLGHLKELQRQCNGLHKSECGILTSLKKERCSYCTKHFCLDHCTLTDNALKKKKKDSVA